MDAILDSYLPADLIQRPTSPYTSPVVIIPKKSDRIWLAIDYRKLNNISILGQHTRPSYMNRLDRLPLTVFEHPYARGHQSLARDQLEYVDLTADRQRRSCALVREQHALNVARVERRNSALSLSDGLRQLPIYAIGVWVWTYNTAATIRQGVKAGTDFKVLKAKLSLNWTGPFKVLAVGPSPAEATPDGRPLASKLLYLCLLYTSPSPRD